MTTTTTASETRLFSYQEIRDFAEKVHMTACHVYYYGFYTGETGEDPHGVLHTADELIDFLMNDIIDNYTTLGHLLVIYGEDDNGILAITA